MGIFDSLAGLFGSKEKKYEPDIDEVVSAADAEGIDAVTPPARMYVKKIPLASPADLQRIKEELGKDNIVIADVTSITRREETLRRYFSELKAWVSSINGDMALLTQNFVMLTPRDVKIVKTKKRRS